MTNVLIVEDSEFDLVLIKRTLKKVRNRDFQVFSSRTMLEAIALLKCLDNIDVILLDLNLPDTVDAKDTYQRMLGVCADIPILILTNLFDHDLALKTLDVGIEDYMLKSTITEREGALVEKIDYVIHRHQYFQSLVKRQCSENEQLIHMLSGGYSVSQN